MVSVLIQAGHSAAFPPHVPNGGGAPGEAEWAAILAQKVDDRLQAQGVEVTLVGCWALDNSSPPGEVKRDYDLFLSFHYDANLSATVAGYDTGCFCGRATLDPQAVRADQFIAIWNAIYPEATAIALHPERLNANVTDYYAFRVTSKNTPGVLLEHGVGQGSDHETLFTHIDMIADTDAQAVLQFLGIQTQPMQPSYPDLQAQIDQLNGVLTTINEQLQAKDQLLQDANSRNGALEHDVIPALQQQIADLQDQLNKPAPPTPSDELLAKIRALLS